MTTKFKALINSDKTFLKGPHKTENAIGKAIIADVPEEEDDVDEDLLD